MTTFTIDTGDGLMDAYVAKPAAASAPGLVLIQEIFGVNKVMRDLADGFAAQGFLTVCPDLFWRIEPGIDITDQSEAEWKRAFELFNAFNPDKGIHDLGKTLAALRQLPGCSGKVGAVGYCLGGKLAYMMATRTSVDATVGYYGVGLDQLVGEAKSISRPLMLHIAGKDGFSSPEAQKKLHEALDGHKLATLYDYPEEEHAFARAGGEHYSQASADLANSRTLDFFKKTLA
jgi:carboxymethylenebutenolidase